MGVVLVYMARKEAKTAVNMFGTTIETGSIAVACIFIGAVIIIMTIRRTFKSLDIATAQGGPGKVT